MDNNLSQDREKRKERLKRLRKKRAKKLYVSLTFMFCLCLVLAVVINFIYPDRKFSDSENRMLAQGPTISINNILGGTFMEEFESYVSDQFFMRDQWISLKVSTDKLLGKKESNGVYLGKDGYLMEVQGTPNKESLKRNLEAIQDFYARHTDLNINMTLVPNACYILKNRMPGNAPVRNQQTEISEIKSVLGNSVNFLDVTSALQLHANEYIYYKTDHHWTSLGAYYAFKEMAEGMGITDLNDAYNVYTVSNNFSGTLASKSGYHGSIDSVQIYTPQDDNLDYITTYSDTQEKNSSIYVSSCLNDKDKYTVFFGGNHTMIDIQTTNETNKVLLVLKDSYANSFIQFLLPYYREIIIIDPRYYYDSIDQVIDRSSVTDVLYLYNLNTFLEDTSLADTLAPDESVTSQDTDAAKSDKNQAVTMTTTTNENNDTSSTETDETSTVDETTENNGYFNETSNMDTDYQDTTSEDTTYSEENYFDNTGEAAT